MKFSKSSILKITLLAILFVAIVASQLGYDATKKALPPGQSAGVSPAFVRLADMGFHSAAGSFLWISTMPEILGVYFQGSTQYIDDLAFVNAVDPKLSYPYAFSVLTLPAIQRFPNRHAVAAEIGARGVRDGDSDWRVPYYLGATYYLDLKDEKNALKYYDIAAHTPGIPEISRSFALNFAALPNDHQKTRALWVSIRDTTNDESVKQRADDYIYRLEILDYLDTAAKAYKMKKGIFPKNPEALVEVGVIPEIPQDPFGYSFIFNDRGLTSLDLEHPPQP